MIELVFFGVFFGALVIGSLVADARGVLPSAEQLQDEDTERLRRWQASR